jgi:hypothetical protein
MEYTIKMYYRDEDKLKDILNNNRKLYLEIDKVLTILKLDPVKFSRDYPYVHALEQENIYVLKTRNFCIKYQVDTS